MLVLPIDSLIPTIVESLSTRPRLVLEAPPGAGKTTRVPRALFDAKILGPQREILVLEPRRLAARMAAKRVADEMGERIGETVGYAVRFEDVSSAKTRIRFVTEGVLTRRILEDPTLSGVGAVLLDEFHERHLQGDIALALLRRLSDGARPDLRIIVMSATLATAPVADYLSAPTLRAEGRRFDVGIEYLPAADDRPIGAQVASSVRRLVAEGLDGDVLVFLPGAAEIRKTAEACTAIAQSADLEILPLHGDLPPSEQDRAVAPASRRKVILSTNVAESSITIDGVVAVIDSGLARVASHAPWSGLPRLTVERVSRASATQRAGRAGRTRPGRCLRLYTKGDFDMRPEHDAAEIRRLDLAQTLLELRAANVDDIAWFEPPPASAVDAALLLLTRLGALDARGAITPLGREMARLPVHPRQARVVMEGKRRGVALDACTVAALLGEREIRLSEKTRFEGPRGGRTHAGATERSDIVAMLDVFREASASRFAAHAMRAIGLDPGATLGVERARAQLSRAAGAARSARESEDEFHTDSVESRLLQCVLAGYPDRVARRVRRGGRSIAVAGGGTAELAESSAVRDAMWLVAVDAEERGASGPMRGVSVRVASAVEPEWLIELFAERIVETSDIAWNAAAERVDAVDRMTYEGLVLTESPSSQASPSAGGGASNATSKAISSALAHAAVAAGARRFAAEGELDRWLARARFAASVAPEIVAPTANDVRAAIEELCDARRSFAELRDAGLLDLLNAKLGYAYAADVERLAPSTVSLGGGRTTRVEYDEGKPPWIESYLQDFFGMLATPRLGDGRAAVVVHLWAPNKRAVQVTSDLGGFWTRHYPALRKELMRKYPRHNWPEDPTKPAPRFAREARSTGR